MTAPRRNLPPGLACTVVPTWPAWDLTYLSQTPTTTLQMILMMTLVSSLHQYWRDDGLGMLRSRWRLDDGLFTCLFEKYKTRGRWYKRYGGKYFTVNLVTLAMQVGAEISAEQLDYSRSIYKSAGLFDEGVKQFGQALDRYKSGEPYDFESKGLYDMMAEKKKKGLYTKEFTYSHIGDRFFEATTGTSLMELKKIDEARPPSCRFCGKINTELDDSVTLRRCSKCRLVAYRSQECQKEDWTVHKKGCYTPAQQLERQNNGKGGGPILTSMGSDCSISTVHIPRPVGPWFDKHTI